MVFSSIEFIFLFLPLTILLALPLRRNKQNATLLVLSIFFYLWGAGNGIIWLLFVALSSYIFALLINNRKWKHSAFEFLALAVILSPLLAFKYLPVLRDFDASAISIIIPLGISFFTFHAISYFLDVSRGNLVPEHRFDHYLLYLFFFPHQIAGPIVRYSEIVDEIKDRSSAKSEDLIYGFSRFSWGLAKKTLIADPCGAIANQAFAGAGTGMGSPQAWLGAICFTIQIYFDFSAYSDMAIGLARIFGFKFPENFASPYTAISATEFWRRWHITLSRWFRDYVYIPLGGNRKGAFRGIVALLITFSLTSLWHGATQNFLIWGGMWSLLLIIEKVTGIGKLTGYTFIRRIFMLFFIIFSWVSFRAIDTSTLIIFWSEMFSGDFVSPAPAVLVSFTPLSTLAFLVGVAYLLIPSHKFQRFFDLVIIDSKSGKVSRSRALPVGIITTLIGVTLTLYSDFSPFLYFNF
jgi:alginate O-acetyltransferase complex protein AlgI